MQTTATNISSSTTTDYNRLFVDLATNGAVKKLEALYQRHQADIDVNWKNLEDYGATALMNATLRGHGQIVKWILENTNADVGTKTTFGATALHCAAQKGFSSIALMLVEHGVNINETDDHGNTALIYGANFGHVDIVKLLLERGADLSVKGSVAGNSALICAAQWGHLALVQALLDYGANIDDVNSEGQTALMWAISSRFGNLVKLLLKEGANINARNHSGDAALHVALIYGDTRWLLPILLLHGANPWSKDRTGKAPLLLAADKRAKNSVKRLLAHEAGLESFPYWYLA